VIDVEKGHPRGELALVLRAIDALKLQLDARTDAARQVKPAGPIDIDAIIADARKTRP